MDYVSVEEARGASGLRLVLTGGLPAPWSESAKGVFRARNVSYTPVLQVGGGTNEEVVAWTGHRNAPTAMYGDDPARVTAFEIISLAERIGSGPSLVPPGIEDRVLMFGLLNEIAGEGGLAWHARMLMFAGMIEAFGEQAMRDNPMLKAYDYSAENAAIAPEKIIEKLEALSQRLKEQELADSRYFFGDSLSALDIYWACFSQMLDPLPAEVNPMPDYVRDGWGQLARVLQELGYNPDPILLKHRDYIFPNHLQWPLDF